MILTVSVTFVTLKDFWRSGSFWLWRALGSPSAAGGHSYLYNTFVISNVYVETYCLFLKQRHFLPRWTSLPQTLWRRERGGNPCGLEAMSMLALSGHSCYQPDTGLASLGRKQHWLDHGGNVEACCKPQHWLHHQASLVPFLQLASESFFTRVNSYVWYKWWGLEVRNRIYFESLQLIILFRLDSFQAW